MIIIKAIYLHREALKNDRSSRTFNKSIWTYDHHSLIFNFIKISRTRNFILNLISFSLLYFRTNIKLVGSEANLNVEWIHTKLNKFHWNRISISIVANLLSVAIENELSVLRKVLWRLETNENMVAWLLRSNLNTKKIMANASVIVPKKNEKKNSICYI